jgi:hypothetical protein
VLPDEVGRRPAGAIASEELSTAGGLIGGYGRRG